MSPKHAAALLGITNTAGALAGLLGVAATGALLEMTGQSWELALFYPCIACASHRCATGSVARTVVSATSLRMVCVRESPAS